MIRLFTILVAVLCLAVPALAGDLVNVSGASGFALDGYDPVAFFTDAAPVHGSPMNTASYHGATYMFASKEHKAAFEADPAKYAPQFGGFCAYGAARGALFPVDISTWQIQNGKLYLNLNPAVLSEFNKDIPGYVADAEKNWPELVKKYSK